MQSVTFAALLVPSLLGCPLISGTCYLPFMWPPWAPSTFHTFSIASVRLSFYLAPIPSHFWPGALTFKWQLFPDLFRKLPPCLVVPTGTTSEALRLTESISRQNSHAGASFGNMTRLEVMCGIVWGQFSTAPDVPQGHAWWRRVTAWQRVKLDSGFSVMSSLHSTLPNIKHTTSSLMNCSYLGRTRRLYRMYWTGTCWRPPTVSWHSPSRWPAIPCRRTPAAAPRHRRWCCSY